MPKHVALVFPGRRYGPEMPVLHYPAQAVRQLGADVQVIRYPQFLVSAEAPSEQQWEQASELLSAAVLEHVAGASRVTLLAKSLGTRVIARLPRDLLSTDVAAVWLTPIFADAATAEAAAAKPWRSLYVYGTADPACDSTALTQIVARTGGRVVAIDRGDHGLEVDADVEATVDALAQVTREVLRFLDDAVTHGGARPRTSGPRTGR